MDRRYIAIDLKSFYASVECVERKLDPMAVNLVVADPERTEKTICLAVSPALKAFGIPGRARLFEVNERMREVNAERFRTAKNLGLLSRNGKGELCFSGASCSAPELKADPSLKAEFLTAVPRMALYEKTSLKVLSAYLKYVSSEDIHVYSIDECFIDVTGYLKTYGMTARQLASAMIREVMQQTGITAAAGIGTNLYLAKAAMDILAKHEAPDEDGVRIAELDEKSYRERLWCHRPLTDFWRVGKGTARQLERLGCYTMGDVARLSRENETVLFRAFGVNAELLIDHAWGWEPTRIAEIKAYRPRSSSLSSGQVLTEPYPWDKARIVVREMTEALALDLVRKGQVTRQLVLTVNYDRTALRKRAPEEKGDSAWVVSGTGSPYRGEVTTDYYGRPCAKPAHGSENLDRWTASSGCLARAMMELFDRITDRDLTVRRLNIAACGLIPEEEIPAEAPVQLDLFSDWTGMEKKKEAESAADEKERKLQMAALAIHGKFGKNALLKGMSFQDGATARQRNAQIGGHRAGSAEETEGDDLD